MENSRFGNLPAELRNAIYALVFDRQGARTRLGAILRKKDRNSFPTMPRRSFRTMKAAGGIPNLGLTKTCRQIRQESLGIAYSLIHLDNDLNDLYHGEWEDHFSGWVSSLGGNFSLFRELFLWDGRADLTYELDDEYDPDSHTRLIGETLVYLQNLNHEHGVKFNMSLTVCGAMTDIDEFSLTIDHGLDVYDQLQRQAKKLHGRLLQGLEVEVHEVESVFYQALTMFIDRLRLYKDVRAENRAISNDECWDRVQSVIPRTQYEVWR